MSAGATGPSAAVEEATSRVGIVRFAALRRWAKGASEALGCTVHLYGSALVTKDWRDLDLAVQWVYPPGHDSWLWLCHALSVAASQEVGAPVEVHLHADPCATVPRLLLAGASDA